jgi:hypothetical protein
MEFHKIDSWTGVVHVEDAHDARNGLHGDGFAAATKRTQQA